MSDPLDRIPSANSPQMVIRLLETVGRGIRSVRGLQEALGVQAQTIRHYVHAARWLGLLTPDPGGSTSLSALGLACVYGSRRQAAYVQAVWSNPMAADLLTAGDGRLPTVAQVAKSIGSREDWSPSTVLRRASAVRGLIAPAVGRARLGPPEQEALQMALPLGHAPSVETGPPAPGQGCEGDDPEVYRFVWGHLLDHGELAMGSVQALLLRAGVPSHSAMASALRAQMRGDAALHGSVLVATRASVGRRDLASSTSSIVLSDPGYRAYLRVLLASDHPIGDAGTSYAAWDRWLFGRSANRDTLEDDLAGLLLDRSLDAFPLARGDALAPPVASEPFLHTWSLPGLPLALPPTLSQLLGGVEAVERLLSSAEPASPSIVDPGVVFHGGLYHPLEPVRPGLGGPIGLRMRAVTRAPAITLLAGLLLLHRRVPHRLAVVEHRAGWGIRWGSRKPRPLLEVIEGFAQARRWVLVRRQTGGLGEETLAQVLQAIGVATRVGRQLVLGEDLGVELTREMQVAERLQHLADAWGRYLEGEHD